MNQAVVCGAVVHLNNVFCVKDLIYTLKWLLREALKYEFAITHIILMTLLCRQAASYYGLYFESVSQIVWQSSSLFAKTKLICGYMA